MLRIGHLSLALVLGLKLLNNTINVEQVWRRGVYETALLSVDSL
jgi:hypothetical protein